MNFEQAKQKAQALVSQMTLEEKTSQMLYQAPAIPRLGLPSYNWWNEALHGVARAGLSTVFPQSIGLAATFDPALVEQVGKATGEEGRIKNEIYRSEGERGIYKGLTYWSPNINIVRDPRWGRAHEAYGEDPCLTSIMGTAFVNGLQGPGPELQAAACLKHFAVHSGPEETRHGFDAECDERDLRETYLAAFERIVKDTNVAGVMGAYNALNGVPVCANAKLQQQILRDEWGFKGYTVSDCGAISDISEMHHYKATKVEAAAEAVKTGCDLNCGTMYGYLLEAVEKGYLEETCVDEAVIRLMTIRSLLNMDSPETDAKQAIDTWLKKQREWVKLNLKSAEESMVLLQNNGILPLKSPKTVAVIGPNARNMGALEGNYHGTADKMTTVYEGIKKLLPDSEVLVTEGCHLYKNKIEGCALPDDQVAEAVAFARYADVSVVCLGLDPSIEGELGDASNEYAAGDKHSLYLPDSQRRMLKAICEVSDNVIVVLMSGGALELGEEQDKVAAILQAWYPGATGGEAVARVLTGKANPVGRLPVTFYYNEQVDWDFEDYHMEGKTYRFFKGEPLYPFGFGLSYRTLELSDLTVEDGKAVFTANNPHNLETAMPIQVYVKITEEGVRTPNFQLVAAMQLKMSANERRKVEVTLPEYWLQVVQEDGVRRAANGEITLFVGDHQPDERSEKLCGKTCLQVKMQ
ncbi:MAG: glycoside hydrolase family 3 C-terminal domain-containing protein [Firmicutes bacterium]|nr:glycoside hydrolase family 3 C-terminal domain-containing protein [Bacillota bacterium]